MEKVQAISKVIGTGLMACNLDSWEAMHSRDGADCITCYATGRVNTWVSETGDESYYVNAELRGEGWFVVNKPVSHLRDWIQVAIEEKANGNVQWL
jgi:hypothetical protein